MFMLIINIITGIGVILIANNIPPFNDENNFMAVTMRQRRKLWSGLGIVTIFLSVVKYLEWL
jgi:hypothetical protein